MAINRVISQDPSGGSLKESGQVVTIEVSAGPERLPVPDVVGKTSDEARSALEAFKVAVRRRRTTRPSRAR